MKELYSNGFASSIAQAIEEMKAEQGDGFSLDRINLAELERRSGVSRGKLRRLKRNGFQDLPRSSKGRKHAATKLSGYIGIIGSLLRAPTGYQELFGHTGYLLVCISRRCVSGAKQCRFLRILR